MAKNAENATRMSAELVDYLSVQEREFVRLYVLTANAYGSFIKAFPPQTPKEAAIARSACYRVMKREHIADAIKAAKSIVRRRMRLDASRYLSRTALIANAEIGDFYDFDVDGTDPKPRPCRDIPAEMRAAIKEIHRTESRYTHKTPDGTITEETRVGTRFVLHDVLRAQKMLYEHLGLNKPVNPLEDLLKLLPLDLQHQVAERLRTAFRGGPVVGEPPAIAAAPASSVDQHRPDNPAEPPAP